MLQLCTALVNKSVEHHQLDCSNRVKAKHRKQQTLQEYGAAGLALNSRALVSQDYRATLEHCNHFWVSPARITGNSSNGEMKIITSAKSRDLMGLSSKPLSPGIPSMETQTAKSCPIQRMTNPKISTLVVTPKRAEKGISATGLEWQFWRLAPHIPLGQMWIMSTSSRIYLV